MANDVQQRAVFLHLPQSRAIDIHFQNITYTVDAGRKKGKKQILKGVSGCFKSGELTAIMGPSGAGKSSLLNILTGFRQTGMGGTITSSGTDKQGSEQYRKESCYILQDDQLTPLFTVQEVMTMAVDLKIGTSLSDKAKQLVIDDVLDTLGLSEHKETRCERLSGGQKKRLSIALELVDNPPVMFLDEPTTGLDSSSSAQCLAMLKALARGGRTIICTIHQPSASLYEQFDHVYVLSSGNCIYQGASVSTVPYLTSVGLHCPQYHNPADYLMEVANGDYGNFTDQLTYAASDIEKWRNVQPSTKLDIVEEIKVDQMESHVPNNKALVLISPPSEWTKFGVLLQRSFRQVYRDWTVTHVKFLLHLFVGILLGLNYLNSGSDGSKTFSNVGYLLITAVYLTYTSMMPAVLRFPSELPVLKKERFNNWYCLKTYYAAFMIVDTPLQMMFCLVYASVTYVMSAQPHDWTRFLMFVGACILITLTSESMGILLGTTVNPINGTFLGAIMTATMLVLAGFLVLFAHMPRVMVWISYFSFLRHGLEALVQAIYGRGREALTCPEDVHYCHYKAPQKLLEEIGMDQSDYWFNIGILFMFLLVLRVLAFCTLKNKLKNG